MGTWTCDHCGIGFERPAWMFKGEKRYCSKSCSSKAKRHAAGERHGNWKGGRYVTSSGYVMVLDGHRRYVREHRLVMERHLGRALTKDEIVHHVNHDKTDNRIENLTITTQPEHHAFHPEYPPHLPDPLRGRWSYKFPCCQVCGTTERPHRAKGMCAPCYKRSTYTKRRPPKITT